jgi:hypothetical protein
MKQGRSFAAGQPALFGQRQKDTAGDPFENSTIGWVGLKNITLPDKEVAASTLPDLAASSYEEHLVDPCVAHVDLAHHGGQKAGCLEIAVLPTVVLSGDGA